MLDTLGWLIGAAVGLVIGLVLLLAIIAVLWLVSRIRPLIDYSKDLLARDKEILGLDVVDGKITIDLPDPKPEKEQE
jgi:hypothetical protein